MVDLLNVEDDLYATLDVGPDTDEAGIKRAYRKLVLKWHPDKNQGAGAEAKFFDIQQAYSILSDPNKKRIYDFGRKQRQKDGLSRHDRKVHEFFKPRPPPNTAPGPGEGFANIFRGPPPGRFNGASSKNTSKEEATPSSKPGAGASPQPSPQFHRKTSSRSWRQTNQQRDGDSPSRSQATPDGPDGDHVSDGHASDGPPNEDYQQARAYGRQSGSLKTLEPMEETLQVSLEELYAGFTKVLRIKRRIEETHGQFREEEVALEVEGLPGWYDGTRITFAKAGDQRLGYMSQDVIVVLEQTPHRIFVRDCDDLHVLVRVPLMGALFGHTTDIPHLSKEVLHVPADGVRPDSEIVMAGKGMPRTSHGADGPAGYGDLVIRFEIIAPAHIRSGIVSHDPARPTDWRQISVNCSTCGETFVPSDLTAAPCQQHPGVFVPKSQSPSKQDDSETSPSTQQRSSDGSAEGHWSCCGRPQTSPGCVEAGSHIPTKTSKSRAKSRAAFNALCAVASYGDAYACGRYLIYCKEDGKLEIPAKIAADNSNCMALFVLLRAGADFTSLGNPMSVLSRAAENDGTFIERLSLIVRHDPDMVDVLARIPGAIRLAFRTVCRKGEPELAKDMLEHQRIGRVLCDIRGQLKDTCHLVARSIAADNADVVQAVVRAGFSVDFTDDWRGRTPLMMAVEQNRSSLVNLLLGAGADPNVLVSDDDSGTVCEEAWTPLQMAASQGLVDVARALLEAGANASWASALDGKCALHWACQRGDVEMTRLLIRHGARTSSLDFGRRRPIDLVAAEKRGQVAEILQPAVFDEALESMDGLTIVRILLDELGDATTSAKLFSTLDFERIGPDSRQDTKETQQTLRATITVLDEALRTLCVCSDGMQTECLSSDTDSDATVSGALTRYHEWKDAKSLGVPPPQRLEAGRAAVRALISAGVVVKASLQEALTSWEDDEFPAASHQHDSSHGRSNNAAATLGSINGDSTA